MVQSRSHLAVGLLLFWLIGCGATVFAQGQPESVTDPVTNPGSFFDVSETQIRDRGRPVFGDVKEGLIHIDFDEEPDGTPMLTNRSRDVGEVFASRGARFRCLQPGGRVVCTGYKFKRSKSRNRSVGNFFVRPDSGKRVSYQGVTRIDFCDPRDPTKTATVTKAGMFTEIVIPDHTLVEAYNASGHRIGVVVSDTARSAFMGFESETPIAWLEVKANEFLTADKLNKDFAIDDLVFDEPVVDPTRLHTDEPTVITADGTRKKASSETMTSDELVWYHGSVNYPQVSHLRDPGFSPDKTVPAEGVYVMLDDASVVRCVVNELGFRMAGYEEVVIPMDSVAGYWGANRRAMYPVATEGVDDAILVHPLYCVQINVPKLDTGRFIIDLDKAKVVTPQSPDDVVGEEGFDYTIKRPENSSEIADDFRFLGIQFLREVDAASVFPVWLNTPPARSQGLGFVRTYDGQEFTLGSSAGFVLDEITEKGVKIRVGDQVIGLSPGNIQTIYRPWK